MKSSWLVVCTVGLAAWTAGCASSRGQSPDAMDDAPPPITDGSSGGIDAPPAMPGERIRLVAGNLTSGSQLAYELPGIRIFRGLAADIALVQEFNHASNSATDLRSFVDQAFGAGYSFVRGAPASGGIPNGIVTRYPIIASGTWPDPEVGNRDFVWARIDIPGAIDLFAISVHLLTSNPTERNLEAIELVRNISALPPDVYVVLGGDFNTAERTEPCVETLSAVLDTAGPYPVDQSDVDNTNASRSRPYDWVMTSTALDALETEVVIGRNRFPHGFVADTRVYSPITDLAPAIISDSGVAGMQHMAVVRDFRLPPGQAAVRVVAPNGGETWAAGSSQTIRWTASGIANVRVELTTDGTTWSELSSSTDAAAGQLVVTAPATATTTAQVRVTAVPGPGPSDASDAAFTITIGSPPVSRVFINEVLANEPGSDVNGEFVELVNTGAGDADLSGWTISDATGVRHTFASGTILRGGRAVVVFGGASGIPDGLGNAIAASNPLTLGNSGDTVTVRTPTAMVDTVTYTAAQAQDSISINRNPDGSATGSFALHNTLSSSPSSPGKRVDGSAF